jgi:hypothetical protein
MVPGGVQYVREIKAGVLPMYRTTVHHRGVISGQSILLWNQRNRPDGILWIGIKNTYWWIQYDGK